MVGSDPAPRAAGAAECGACRSPGTTSSATACGPSSSTAPPPAPTPRCSTSGSRTRGRTAPGWRSSCAVPVRRPRTLLLAWTPAGCAARLPAERGGPGRRGGRALERGRRGEADLRRVQAAAGGRHPRARGARRDRRADARHRHHPDGEGRPVARAHRTSRRAVPPLLPGRATRPTPTSSRSGCRCSAPGWSSSRVRRRRCCAGSPAGAGRPPGCPTHLDPVRAVLHLLGPATPRQVAAYVDSPVREVAARWPEDVTAVEVDGEERSMLAADVEALTGADDVEGVTDARAVRPVPAGPGPGDGGAGRGGPQGPVAHPRAARRAARRARGGRHLAAAVLREEAAPAGGGVVRGGAPGRHRRGGRTPGRLPGPGVRRLRASARPARGSGPCPGRHRRTW